MCMDDVIELSTFDDKKMIATPLSLVSSPLRVMSTWET